MIYSTHYLPDMVSSSALLDIVLRCLVLLLCYATMRLLDIINILLVDCTIILYYLILRYIISSNFKLHIILYGTITHTIAYTLYCIVLNRIISYYLFLRSYL